MCSTDYELADVYVVTKIKARKQHRCYECGTSIPTGEIYERVFMAYDGGAHAHRTHLACRALADFIMGALCGNEGVILHGALSEECHDAWHEYGAYYQDHDAWETAGLEPPNPLEQVFNEIQDHYQPEATS